jgi:hypothetical protein
MNPADFLSKRKGRPLSELVDELVERFPSLVARDEEGLGWMSKNKLKHVVRQLIKEQPCPRKRVR